GSVRWLLLDFLIEQITAGEHHWTLRPRPTIAEVSAAPFTYLETPLELVVHSGTTEFFIGRFDFSLTARGIGAESAPLLASLGFPFHIALASHLSEPITLETGGPVRVTVCLRSPTDLRRCSYVARFDFFGGTGLVRIRLTTRNERRASHQGGLWDLGDREAVRFKELALSLDVYEATQIDWKAETSQPVHSMHEEKLEIYQDSSGGENWQSRNQVNSENRVPCSFRGYRVRHGEKVSLGLRASPIVSCRSEKAAVTVAIPEFWQQFPKALTIEHGARDRLVLGLLPAQ